MISKASVRYIKSLQDKKQRQKYSQFIVEGEKSITELLKSRFNVVSIYALREWLDSVNLDFKRAKVEEVSYDELRQISSHQSPQKVLALVDIPEALPLSSTDNYILALDEIQDPGNLGTIIRIADWYGIKHIVCSKGCTDVYNPKCINSTMGSFLRVNVLVADIVSVAKSLDLPLMVAVLNGQNVHSQNLPKRGMLVIGNEGHGISSGIIEAAKEHLTIPRFGGAESLNAAVSTAILLDNLIR